MKLSKLQTGVKEVFEICLPRLMGSSFESREGQVDMALKVAAAFDERNILFVEAETGLGKSLAYLVPMILYCKHKNVRAVVSTYTRNLQRQLLEKDFPLASAAAGGDVNGAALLGRTNYACRRRVEKLLAVGISDPKLAAWLEAVLEDEVGELENIKDSSVFLDLPVRAEISCPRREASCSGCRQRDRCFLFYARRRALESQVVMVNHALLFSNLATGGALLGPYDTLIVDESHHLDEVATQFLTLSYSPGTIRGSQRSLYSPEYEDNVAYARAMVAYESEAAGKEIDNLWVSYHQSMVAADKKTGELFTTLSSKIAALARQSPGGRNDNGSCQIVYGEGAPFLYGTETLVAEIAAALGEMTAAAEKILEIVEGHEKSSECGIGGALKAIGDVAEETLAEFRFLTAGSADDHVFYARSTGDWRLSELAASPVDVSTHLGTMLETGAESAVLTSATLAVDGDFSYALNLVGLEAYGRVKTCRYDSPFDLESQRGVYIASYLPDPGSENFLAETSRTVAAAVKKLGKRTLVLCTAKNQIPFLVQHLSSGAGTAENILKQTEGGSRADLLARFKNNRRSILIGLASFWEGVDLPGELLECLIIVKLPFLVPSEPVVQARAKRLRDAGENPFEKLFVPDAILKLRQGIGRLIRTDSDRGVVLLLDRRLWHSHYGEFISSAAAGKYINCENLDSLIEQIGDFFSRGNS